MVAGWAFVDAVTASPTVLLNLHDRNPIHVRTWEAPPPDIRRSVSTSMLFDGGLEAGSVYQDRELDVSLFFATQGEDAAAATFQALVRILDAPAWLRYTPDGATNPVFFRTRRVPPRELEEFRGVVGGAKSADITIPAAPFAYGLPESGTATITNDPTTGTNKLGLVMPTIKGDVTAPLNVVVDNSTNVVSTAERAAIWINPDAGGFAPTNWAITDGVADSNAVGGTAKRLVKSAATSAQPRFLFPATTVPRGDWRIFVRARATAGTSKVTVGPNETTTLDIASYGNILDSDYKFIDIGVFRLPLIGPASAVSPIVNPTSIANLGTGITTTSATATIFYDGILLVPAGLDGEVDSLAMISPVAYYEGGDPIEFDSEAQQVRETTTGAPFALAGGFPFVRPGRSNVLTLMSAVGAASFTWSLSWKYYPRYLYTRPATS